MKTCIECGVEIPSARLKALPGTKTCVKHSTSEKKVGVPVAHGQGDHTYVELEIMEAEDYNRITQQQKSTSRGEFV